MRIRKMRTFGVALLTSALLLNSVVFSFAAREERPMKPELAAKKEMVRKQKEQRVTSGQRKIAADSLKDERRKVYQAKQQVKNSKPVKSEEK